MSKTTTVAIATREGYPPLEYAVTFENNEEPTREDLAFQLVVLAQNRHSPLIPDGRRGASREERLAEFGYSITSVISTISD